MKMPVKDRKVQLLVWISEDVDRKLRELIQQKYKEFQKGILSAEVEVAIRNHIAAHLNDKNKFEVKEANPQPRVYSVYQQVKDYLAKQNIVYQCPLKKLKEAITAIRGSDPRTIRKWLKEFERWKLIKMVAPSIYELC